MSGRMDQLELAAAESNPHLVFALRYALARNRNNPTIELTETSFTIDRNAPLDQFRRIDHVTGAARMDHSASIGERLHQEARATRLIQVDVRKQYVLDLIADHVELIKRFQQMWNSTRWPGIDECRAPIAENQMTRVVTRTDVLRVDRVNSICGHDVSSRRETRPSGRFYLSFVSCPSCANHIACFAVTRLGRWLA